MKVLLSLAVIVLALLGILDASYLTYEKLIGHIPFCNPGFDCGQVLNSEWASIGPIPLSLFGVFYYLAVFILGIAYYVEVDALPIIGSKFSTLSLIRMVTSSGFVFSLFLVYLMGAVIKAWCLYCLISAGISTLLFITSNVLFWVTRGKVDKNMA